MALKLDFSKVETRNFDPVPAGTYAVRVEKVTEKTSKAGSAMWNLQLKITDGDYEGRVVFDLLVDHPKSLWHVKEALVAFRLVEEDAQEIEVDPSDLYGCECLAKLTVEESEGYDPQNRVKQYLPL